MELVIVGPGRAGGSLALAAEAAGHRLVGVLSRRPSSYGPPLSWDKPLPDVDLVLVTVSDSAIGDVVSRLVPQWSPGRPAAHVSGFTSVTALDPIAEAGGATGCLHPLQTLPDPERGSQALAGSWAAVTSADAGLAELLSGFAESLGMTPFPLDDAAKPTYHAAAAAASNFVVEALAVSADLFTAAGVAPTVAEPLTRRVVDNVFAIGAVNALTGPIARGDRATVEGQLAVAEAVSPSLGRQFRLLVEATAERVGFEL